MPHATYNYKLKNMPANMTHFYNYIKAVLIDIDSVTNEGNSLKINFPYQIGNVDKNILDNLITNYTGFEESSTEYRQFLTSNSTDNNLSANSIFNGTFIDVSDYKTIKILINTNVNSAVNGLEIIFSTDSQSTDFIKYYTIFGNEPFVTTLSVVAKYFKLRYVNGSNDQTNFKMQCMCSYNPDKDNNLSITSPIRDSSDCTLNKSIIAGRLPNSQYTNVTSSADGRLNVFMPFSAFGEVKTEIDTPVVQMSFAYNINPSSIISSTVGSGTISHNDNYAVLQSGTSQNSKAILKTRRFLKYRPGQGARCLFTSIWTNGIEGNKQIMGMGTHLDGFFFGFNGNRFGILRRDNGDEYWTYQDNWNIDKLDGTGTSSMVLDKIKGNVYSIQFQWLGFGCVIFSIEETISGLLIPVHKIRYANTNIETTITNPSFPIRLEVENTTNTSNVTMKCPSMAAFIEGNIVLLGPKFSIDNTKTLSSTSITNLITIRNKSEYMSKINMIQINPTLMSILGDGNKNFVVYIIRDAIITDLVSWTDISSNSSVVEYNTTGSTVTGGDTILSLGCSKVSSRDVDLRRIELFLDPGEMLTIAARLTGGGTNEVSVSMAWIEDQ